jgi:nucleoside-diphosphate-sugar epimerase
MPASQSGSSRALIVGGAGFIGHHLATSLVARGDEVVVLDRARPCTPVAGATYHVGDVRQPLTEQLCREAPNIVYNLAAVHRVPGHPDEDYYATNVAGATNVTDYCRAVGVSSLVFTSSISVYGASEEPKHEASTTAPDSAYGGSKVEAEVVHQAWADEDPSHSLVVVRPAVVFGVGEGGNFTRLAAALKAHRFVYPGRRDTVKGCGYVGELVRTMAFAVELGRPRFLYNFCYPTPYTIEDICHAFRRVGGLPRPLGTVPLRPMVAAGRTFDRLSRLGLRTDIGEARIMKLVRSTHIVPQALLDAGYEFETDLDEGLRRWRDAPPVGTFV